MLSLTKYLISKHVYRGALQRIPETHRYGWRLCSGTCFSERMGRGYSAEYDCCRLWVTYCSRRQLGHNFNDHNTAIIRTPKKTLVSILKILCLKNNMQKNRRGTAICYLHWSQEVFMGPGGLKQIRLSKFTQLSHKATFNEMCNVRTVLERSWNSIINFPHFKTFDTLLMQI